MSQPFSTLAAYASNLEAIFDTLARTACRVVWASSTPIDQARHATNTPSRRYAIDLLRYNEASARMAKACGYAVNDLYGCVAGAGTSRLLLPDGVHFNAAGNALIGSAIADAICGVANTAPTSAESVLPRNGLRPSSTDEL
jgi:lysophospholipase L1-like esterase